MKTRANTWYVKNQTVALWSIAWAAAFASYAIGKVVV